MKTRANTVNQEIVFLFVILLALTYTRQPLLFLSPRIWAEEGSIYLQKALEGGFFETFFQQHLGYYSLATKFIIEIAARYLPLEYAAHVTTFASALIQILTSLIIYTTYGPLVNTRFKRYLLSISPFLFSTPEVWLNSINLHFWLATGTFFILNSYHITRLHLVYLFISFLTGVSSLFFYPFFLLRALIEKSKTINFIAAGGAMCALVQTASFFDYMRSSASIKRFRPEYLNHILGAIRATTIPFAKVNGMEVLFLMLLIFTFFAYSRKQIQERRYLELALPISSLILYVLLSVFASLGMSGGGRYGLPVYCGLFALIISGCASIKGKWLRHLCAGAIAILISYKALAFFQTESIYSAKWPNWKTQLRERTCPIEQAVILFPRWPGTDWRMTIPAQSGVPCKANTYPIRGGDSLPGNMNL